MKNYKTEIFIVIILHLKFEIQYFTTFKLHQITFQLEFTFNKKPLKSFKMKEK